MLKNEFNDNILNYLIWSSNQQSLFEEEMHETCQKLLPTKMSRFLKSDLG